MFMKAVANWHTTLTGCVFAVLTWWAGVGWKWPETKQEWTAAIGSAALAVLGTVAKDGATGSPPGATH